MPAMGVETVAVYSDADADSPHVRFRRRGRSSGRGHGARSYLRIDKIIEAARSNRASGSSRLRVFVRERRVRKKLRGGGIVFIGLRPARFGRWG